MHHLHIMMLEVIFVEEEKDIIDVIDTEEYNFAATDEHCECNDDEKHHPHAVMKCVEDYQKSCVIEIGSCNDVLEYELDDSELSSLGRLLNLSFTVKNVCPYKRVAVAVIVHELDSKNREHPRGLKTFVISHREKGCRDIKVNCLHFVLPESLDEEHSPHSICEKRRFVVRTISHYIDTNFFTTPKAEC